LMTHTLTDLEFPAPVAVSRVSDSSTAESVSRWRWNTRSVPA
jgi:hypothetical protein